MEKNSPGKCTVYIGTEAIPRLFLLCFFIFTNFNIIDYTFGKRYLISKLLVSEKVTNTGGLMLVCRWTVVNALAQNKFRATIHLLSQHLLMSLTSL